MGQDQGRDRTASHAGTSEGKTQNQRRGLAADHRSHKETLEIEEGCRQGGSDKVSRPKNGGRTEDGRSGCEGGEEGRAGEEGDGEEGCGGQEVLRLRDQAPQIVD